MQFMHIHDSGHTQSVLCVDSPDWDDSLLASGSKDNSIFIWRLRPPTKQQLMEVDGDISAAGEDEAETPVIKPVAHATGHTHSVTRF
jgi:WD40 repeat protein